MGTASQLWPFLTSLPTGLYLSLVPWHLLVVLAVLGLLAAFGVHHLLMHGLGAYRAGGREVAWLRWPTLVLLIVTVQVLLGVYGLAARAPALLEQALAWSQHEGPADHLGAMVLAPVLDHIEVGPPEVEKPRLLAAIQSTSTEALQGFYRSRLTGEPPLPPDEPPAADTMDSATDTAPPADDGGIAPDPPPEGYGDDAPTPEQDTAPAPDMPPQAGVTPNLLLPEPTAVQPTLMALERLAATWLLDPEPAAADTGELEAPQAQEDEDGGLYLPDVIASLVAEISDRVAFSMENWAHLAGTRLIGRHLVPWLTGELRFLAFGILVIVVLVVGLYGYLLFRVRRMLVRRARPAAPPARPSAATEPPMP